MLWSLAARELGNALSRYNSLTNSVKLDVVNKVITCDLFRKHPYRYAYEVIAEFKKLLDEIRNEKEGDKEKDKDKGHRSAEVYLQHAILFGFLHSPAASNPHILRQGARRRIEKTSHIALTPLGRACRAAENWNPGNGYKRFLWEYALLECDFDLYGLFMSMTANNDGGKIVERGNLHSSYKQLCNKRWNWLKEKFPKAQLTHVQQHITWMFNDKGVLLNQPFEFKPTTQNHHFLQRRKWAKIWGHLDENECITSEGRQFAACLPSLSESSPFFWLPPSKEYINKVRVFSDNEIHPYLFSPAWNLLRPKEKATSHEDFVGKVADYMKETFDDIRMGHFKQAPLNAVVPYIYFLERESNKRVEEHALFRTILETHQSQLSCLLHTDISRSHYRIK